MQSQTDKKPEAFKDSATEIAKDAVSFDPFKLVRTLKVVTLQGTSLDSDPGKIARCISSQEWADVLSPLKYFSSCITIMVASDFLADPKFSVNPEWSFKSPVFWEFWILVVFPFILVQYIYLAYRTNHKLFEGIADGATKLAQCYAFTVGSAMLNLGFFGILEHFIIEPLDKMGVIGLGLEFIVFLPLSFVSILMLWGILVSPPVIISQLFNASAGATVKSIGLGFGAALMGTILLRCIN
jgi:hypothetical protein